MSGKQEFYPAVNINLDRKDITIMMEIGISRGSLGSIKENRIILHQKMVRS